MGPLITKSQVIQATKCAGPDEILNKQKGNQLQKHEYSSELVIT